MTIVSRLELDHPALDDPGGNALHTQVEGLYIKIGDNLSARYFEGIAVANGATVIFDHNFKMPFDELAFKVYLLAGAGGELTVTTETDYDIIATPGNLTTQISVTNNSGGLSTFAVLIQSLGGGGGGGTELYDVVVDAAGGGDYTEVRAAILAEPTYTKIFIKDGSYSETSFIQPKFGQKIVGQSKAGVILTTSSFFSMPGLAGNTRGVTQRTADNTDWDSVASAGLITLNSNSATASYSGAFLPVANDICLIGPGGDMYDIISVSAPNVTLDRPWRGSNGDVMDWIVLRSPDYSDWKEEETWIKNMTISFTNTSGSGFDINRSWKNVFEDLEILSANQNTGFAGVFYFADSVCKNTMKNISIRATGTVGPFCYMQNGGGYNKFINISAEGLGGARINGTATRPFKYMDFGFTDITQTPAGNRFVTSSNFVVYSRMKVDRLASSSLGIFAQAGTSSIGWYSCEFVFGFVGAEVGGMVFNAGKSRLSIKHGLHSNTDITNRHAVSAADPEFYNTIHDSNLSGTIQAQPVDDLIISSSVTYGGFFNTNRPAYDAGFNFTSPPGGPGQTLYDAIVDAAGFGDYLLPSLAITGEAAGATIYIRNGTYNEGATQIQVREGQKIIGESLGGVVMVWAGASLMFRFNSFNDNWGVRSQSERDTNNVGWTSASGLGVLTVAATGTTVSYTGPTAPVVGDAVLIGKSFTATVVSIGVGNFVMDRPWLGANSSTQDGFICENATKPADFNDWTMIKNIVVRGGNIDARVFTFQGNYGIWIENVIAEIRTQGTSNAGLFTSIGDVARIRFKNCTFDNQANNGGIPFYLSSGCIDFDMENIRITGGDSARIETPTSKPMKHSTWKIDYWGGGNATAFFRVQNVYRCELHVGVMDCHQGFNTDVLGGSIEHWAECHLVFGRWINCTGNFNIIGTDLMVKLGDMEPNAAIFHVKSKGLVGYNIISDTYLRSGQLSIDARAIISGSVAYKALTGVPAQNNGFDIP